MKITDADALERMGRVEGEEWREAQATAPHGFAAWRDVVDHIISDENAVTAEEMESLLLLDDRCVNRAIYGAGGWSRYAVTGAGEIVLLGWSAHDERQAAARAEGIRIG